MMVVDARKLVDQFVAAGILNREQADRMIANSLVPASAATPLATSAPSAIAAGGIDGDVQTIPYIPEPVLAKVREQVKAELAGQAQAEGWAKPGETPEWTRRITLSGDIRVRGEGVRQGDGNFDRSLPNYQAINSGGGFDISKSNNAFIPVLNTTQDRYRARIRARLGIGVQIDDWITAEVRVATGDDRSPVSTNQTLGGNGEFGKYAIWLDRANIRLTPAPGTNIVLGRFANPFWTSELMFDEDLNFDGVALQSHSPIGSQLTVFSTLGAFPIFDTDFNFGSNEAGAFASKDKFLAAAQVGVEFAPTDTLKAKLAAGYFHFQNVQGRVSSPCFFDQDVCDTDDTRPQFIQFGNSLFPIRDVIPNPDDPVGSPEVQYFGLASKYEVLNVHGQIDYAGFGDVGVRLEGDFLKNLGFNRSLVAARAVNNLGAGVLVPDPAHPGQTIRDPGPWEGGDTGWYANLLVGNPDLAKLGDWRAFVGYRHIESDATLDAFTDSDFHLGGTNAKGFILGGGYAIGKGTAINARWLSSDAITSIPYSNDVFQLDLTTKF